MASNNAHDEMQNFGDDLSAYCGYLDAASAAALDEELMQMPGFTLEQLMELAGLAVAEAAYQILMESKSKSNQKILVVCGPGNNGGDGLVAARHLHHFGFAASNNDSDNNVIIVYPKRSSKQPHYTNLVQQCEDLNIPVLDVMPDANELSQVGLIIDAIFGFSFKGEPREPFKTILQTMQDLQQQQRQQGNPCQILAVDVPSGWHVNEGDVTDSGFVPDAVISLTAPKECMRTYTGRHFVGGRFLPPALAEKYQVRMPPYPGVAQVLQVSRGGATAAAAAGDDADWRAGYAAYCAEKEAGLENEQGGAVATNHVDASSSSSWEAQYAAHCAEKEARLAAQDAAESAARKQGA